MEAFLQGQSQIQPKLMVTLTYTLSSSFLGLEQLPLPGPTTHPMALVLEQEGDQQQLLLCPACRAAVGARQHDVWVVETVATKYSLFPFYYLCCSVVGERDSVGVEVGSV